MRYIYILQSGNFNKTTNRFEFYDVEPYSSKKGILQGVKNSIKVNKGYEVENEDTTQLFTDRFKMVTYKCLSVDDKEMQIRYLLTKKELKY